ncbi:MAG: MBL fold metallo-hydrolase [Clostridia bacterium]|nr:MBL fold metallo-hydrolase [Clostridia bacterium]
MKIKYLGTSAAEGIPTIGCSCPMCQKARAQRGRYIRTRSQALVNEDLMLDFNADAHLHLLHHDINMQAVDSILITHPHWDHFVPRELLLLRPKFSTTQRKKPWTVCGGSSVIEQVSDMSQESLPWLQTRELTAFHPVQIGNYVVCALEAAHGTGLEDGYFIYAIGQADKQLLYCHDTDGFTESVWQYFAETKPRFDLISLDCTRGNETDLYQGHMNIEKCKLLRQRLQEEGYADNDTIFVLNHFSHNGVSADYDEMCQVAEPQGFVVSYDGLEIEI